MDGKIGWSLLFFVLLVACSAFFSASEMAYSAVSRVRLKHDAKRGSKQAKRALGISEEFDRLLTSILIGNNIANILSTALFTMIAIEIWGDGGVAAATAITTVVIIVCGEILPKSYAKEHSEKVALRASGILQALMTVFYPISWVLIRMKNRIARTDPGEEERPSVTEEELKYIIEEIEDQGVLEEQESDLVQSALDFDEISVQEILTPRVDVVALDVQATREEILRVIREEKYSRLPVYERSIDNILGFVKSADYLLQAMASDTVSLRALLGKCVYVHRTKKISALLTELRKNKLTMAVVTDDYGGTLGIVTVEDILEQLVGQIWDETDEIVHDVVQKDETTFEVNADMNLEEMREALELPENVLKSDFNTVGGWVLEQFGHIPAVGETFVCDSLRVRVEEAEELRILKISVTKEKTEDEKE